MIDVLFQSIISMLIAVVFVYKWIIIASSILSWVQPNPHNPIMQILNSLTYPVYQYIKRYISTSTGSFDFTPLIILFTCILIENLLIPTN